MPHRNERRSNGYRIAASAAVAVTAAALAGAGTFGTFTSSATTGPVSIQDGTVVIKVAAGDGSASVPLNYPVTPGASSTRAIDLVNSGGSDLASVTMGAVATSSSILDTDPTNGLQTSVQSCSVPWTADFTCAGTQQTVLAAGPVVRTAPLTGALSLRAGATDHLAVTIGLPTGAGDAFKSQSSSLDLTFTAVQRAGSAR